MDKLMFLHDVTS